MNDTNMLEFNKTNPFVSFVYEHTKTHGVSMDDVYSKIEDHYAGCKKWDSELLSKFKIPTDGKKVLNIREKNTY